MVESHKYETAKLPEKWNIFADKIRKVGSKERKVKEKRTFKTEWLAEETRDIYQPNAGTFTLSSMTAT